MSITNLERVKTRLQISSKDTSKDELLKELILEADAYIYGYCRRNFNVSQYTERHKVNHKVFPKNYPVISVENLSRSKLVNNDFGEVVELTDYTYSDTDYIVHPSYIELCDSVYIDISNKIEWTTNESSYVTLSYTAGYKVIPQDLEVAATLVVVYFYNLLSTEGKSTERIGDYSASYTDMPQTIKLLLNKYRKVSV